MFFNARVSRREMGVVARAYGYSNNRVVGLGDYVRNVKRLGYVDSNELGSLDYHRGVAECVDSVLSAPRSQQRLAQLARRCELVRIVGDDETQVVICPMGTWDRLNVVMDAVEATAMMWAYPIYYGGL